MEEKNQQLVTGSVRNEVFCLNSREEAYKFFSCYNSHYSSLEFFFTMFYELILALSQPAFL